MINSVYPTHSVGQAQVQQTRFGATSGSNTKEIVWAVNTLTQQVRELRQDLAEQNTRTLKAIAWNAAARRHSSTERASNNLTSYYQHMLSYMA